MLGFSDDMLESGTVVFVVKVDRDFSKSTALVVIIKNTKRAAGRPAFLFHLVFYDSPHVLKFEVISFSISVF